jgi:hypothetical protein
LKKIKISVCDPNFRRMKEENCCHLIVTGLNNYCRLKILMNGKERNNSLIHSNVESGLKNSGYCFQFCEELNKPPCLLFWKVWKSLKRSVPELNNLMTGVHFLPGFWERGTLD